LNKHTHLCTKMSIKICKQNEYCCSNQNFSLGKSPQKGWLSFRIFIVRFFINWYVNRLKISRTEISGFISLIEKEEFIFDYKSYIISRKTFQMVHTFNELLFQEESFCNLSKVKISIQYVPFHEL
jgi:hypothetical protein